MRTGSVAGGFALALTAGWNLSNTAAVAGRLAHAYAVPLWTVGLLTTGLYVTHAAMQVPAGRLCDRLGARQVGLVGLVLVGVASLLACAWQTVEWGIACRVLAGVGTGLTFVGGSDYVRSSGGGALAQGLYGGASLGCGGLALAVVPQLGGWRAPFWTAAIAACAGAAVVACAPRERTRPPLAPALPSFSDRRLARLALLHSASFGLSVVIGNWVVTLLERSGGISTGRAGLAGALTLALGIVSRPLGGWLLRTRPDARPALAASCIAGGAATALLAVAHPLALAVVAAAVVGFAAGIPFATVFTAAARLRPEGPAAAVGLVNTAAAVTILFATPLVGLTFSLPGDGRIGFAVLAALWLAATAAVRGYTA